MVRLGVSGKVDMLLYSITDPPTTQPLRQPLNKQNSGSQRIPPIATMFNHDIACHHYRNRATRPPYNISSSVADYSWKRQAMLRADHFRLEHLNHDINPAAHRQAAIDIAATCPPTLLRSLGDRGS